MNWTIDGLLGDVANAWSADNWPYTLAFWLILGAITWVWSRHANDDQDESENH